MKKKKNLFPILLIVLIVGISACRPEPIAEERDVTLEVLKIEQTRVNLLVSSPKASQVGVSQDGGEHIFRIGDKAEIAFGSLEPGSDHSYRAIAKFKDGSSVESESIEIRLKSSLSTLEAYDIDLHTATIAGEIYSEESFPYFFEYGVSDFSKRTPTKMGAGLVEEKLTDLKWASDYKFRLVMDLGNNELYYGGNREFRTLGELPKIKEFRVSEEDTNFMTFSFLVQAYPHVGNYSLSYNSLYQGGTNGSKTSQLSENNREWNEEFVKIPIVPAMKHEIKVEVVNELGKASFDTIIYSPAFIIENFIYHCIEYFGLLWTLENYQAEHYKNGDKIPYITDQDEWGSTEEGALCYYEHSLSNRDDFGVLYNCFAVDDARGLGYPGWRIPTEPELRERRMFKQDGTGADAQDMKENDLRYWKGVNEYARPNGFNARGSGLRANEGWGQLKHQFGMIMYSPNSMQKFLVISGYWPWLMVANSPKQYGSAIRFVKDIEYLEGP